jgi:glutaredoxin
MLLKGLRNALGMMIVFVSWLTQPKGMVRSEDEQAQAQAAVSGLFLYQLYACPFCVKTRRALRRLNVSLPIRDIAKNTEYRQELENKGGRVMVPCLRIEEGDEVRWLYQSNDIIRYLENRLLKEAVV